MDRLQKKCVVASAGVHLLLASILLVGPAFISSRDQSPPLPDDLQVLDFVPLKTTDKMISGGGNPNVNSAPPAAQLPPPPKPAPQPKEQPAPDPEPPKKVREPAPPKETVKPVKTPDPIDESLEVSEKPKRKKIEVSLKTVVHKSDSKADAKAKAKAQAEAQAKEEAREYAASRQRWAKQLGQAAENVGNGVSGGTSIELRGPRGGGVPYANFYQAVMSAYDRAWIVPDGVSDDNATVEAKVTIARDGTVVSARITRPSHNAAVDRSVRAALDRVTHTAPLPEEAKEDERTVPINFNVKAKRGIG